jgi:hypothetical protein
MAQNPSTFRKLSIPPLFGRPKLQQAEAPRTIPSRMWLVHLDDNNNRIEALQIQTVPMEITVDPIANWATIPAIGRNNPFYHYTGGEDEITFTLDWYSVREDNEDVIEKCRWVESLSRADAYSKEPPRILLIFGRLFKYDTWIIKSARYRLSLFNKEQGMFPRQAYQELMMSKVTSKNTSRQEVRWYR